jgi:hypothetical protein
MANSWNGKCGAATHCCLFEISANIFKRVLIACSEFTSKSTPVFGASNCKECEWTMSPQRQFVDHYSLNGSYGDPVYALVY